MTEPAFCYVTTTGRVTGLPREIEIWFARDGDTIYLLSGGRDRSQWVRNIRADPAVTVRIGTATTPGTARLLEPGTPEDAHARDLVIAKYGSGYETFKRRALPVAIDLA